MLGLSSTKSRSDFSIVLIGVGLLTLLFISYNLFNGAKKNIEESQKRGTIDNFAAQDIREPEEVAGAESDLTWAATDYKKGDIETGNYVVKRGDTLWEIAEAAYGDGTQWHKILDANKNNIGFLPNGSQALIEIDQILIIP